MVRTVVMGLHVTLTGVPAITPSDCYQAGIWTQCDHILTVPPQREVRRLDFQIRSLDGKV